MAKDLGMMWEVVVAGVLIVFAVLLLLVGVFYLFGAVMKGKGSKNKIEHTAKQNNTPVVKKAAPKAAAPVVQEGIPAEVVAAISAAIAQMEGGNSFTIRSIRRRQPAGTRPTWAMAGIAENTRPF